ncbi:MAG: hypothetical protein M3N57_01850 [Actinomycetota bacterium]|nr:hypothetical protein [Actinomycetota bacterium]
MSEQREDSDPDTPRYTPQERTGQDEEETAPQPGPRHTPEQRADEDDTGDGS